MDDIDRQLLNIMQDDFPIDPRPYRILGGRLGITEQDALKRAHRLTEEGIIRRIGPSFDTRKLGYASTLVAARVPTDRLDEVAATVNAFPQVTHNYQRDHEHNLWFTLVCRDTGEIGRVLREISEATGVTDMRELPAERLFKIKVSFEF